MKGADIITRWDAGDLIWTLSMGGLGPGYEQAIQVFAIEIIREALKQDANFIWDDESWRAMADRVLKVHNESLGGLSGAQYGAAVWVAWHLYFDGEDKLRADAKARGEDDRMIMISNRWPRAAEVVPA